MRREAVVSRANLWKILARCFDSESRGAESRIFRTDATLPTPMWYIGNNVRVRTILRAGEEAPSPRWVARKSSVFPLVRGLADAQSVRVRPETF